MRIILAALLSFLVVYISVIVVAATVLGVVENGLRRSGER